VKTPTATEVFQIAISWSVNFVLLHGSASLTMTFGLRSQRLHFRSQISISTETGDLIETTRLNFDFELPEIS